MRSRARIHEGLDTDNSMMISFSLSAALPNMPEIDLEGPRYSKRMAANRLETLKMLLEQSPRDSFLRYGLAMEHRNSGDLESAVGEFRKLIADNPDYVAAYF